MKLVFGLEPKQTSNNGRHYATQLSASPPRIFQSTSEPVASRTVRRYVCTTDHERVSPLQTRAMPGFSFSAASSHVMVCVVPVFIST